ncbi:MAG: 50S ribosomal protein L22 [Verrucomicrobia bacterium]|jgi:large subunit ribosomal protein L22|nr:50S ribosomal protein L22 [Verrucomicrobiota bacterium]
MVVAIAKTKYARVVPRKARLVADMVRGKTALEAMLQLSVAAPKGAHFLKKTLASAIANAENNKDAKREDLYISEVKVDEGSYYKRSWSRNKGRRAVITRKTSHFTVALDVLSNKENKK